MSRLRRFYRFSRSTFFLINGWRFQFYHRFSPFFSDIPDLFPAHCHETLPGGVWGEGGKIPFPQLPEVLLVLSHTDEDNGNYDDDDILLKAASQ